MIPYIVVVLVSIFFFIYESSDDDNRVEIVTQNLGKYFHKQQNLKPLKLSKKLMEICFIEHNKIA